MTPDVLVQRHLAENGTLREQYAGQLADTVAAAAALMFETLLADGKILVCGIGSCKANARLFAEAMTGGFERERMPLAAFALDGGDGHAVQSVYALARPADTLFVCAADGGSPALHSLLAAARDQEIHTVLFTGNGSGLHGLLSPRDVLLDISHPRTARIREIHLLALHALCDCIDAALLDGLSLDHQENTP